MIRWSQISSHIVQLQSLLTHSSGPCREKKHTHTHTKEKFTNLIFKNGKKYKQPYCDITSEQITPYEKINHDLAFYIF